MPIDDPQLLGTEKNGVKSTEYCKFCYQNGEFTNPGLTMSEMKNRMTEKMDSRNFSDSAILKALKRFPGLKRWTQTVQEDSR